MGKVKYEYIATEMTPQEIIARYGVKKSCRVCHERGIEGYMTRFIDETTSRKVAVMCKCVENRITKTGDRAEGRVQDNEGIDIDKFIISVKTECKEEAKDENTV